MRMTKWIKAARLPSQSYIFLPLLLGQTIAFSFGQQLDIPIFFWVQIFGLAIQLYIVFANDYADQETDRCNTTFTPFSGGSRVIVDGDLPPEAIKKAALLMALASIALGVFISVLSQTVWPTLLAFSGVLLLWFYSYPPIKMSYRGGGEFLQMLGVGVVLPCMGYVSQTSDMSMFPWDILWIVLPTQLACAIGTAIPDEPSDSESRKRTIPVMLGLFPARVLVIALHLTTVLQLFMLPYTYPGLSVSIVGPSSALAAVLGQFMFARDKPGSKGIMAATLLSVLTTLICMATLVATFSV